MSGRGASRARAQRRIVREKAMPWAAPVGIQSTPNQKGGTRLKSLPGSACNSGGMGLASKPTSSMEQPLLTPVIRVLRSIWRGSGTTEGERAIPEETAIAFTYNTASYAVMMATPQDLEDFAVGFSLTEGVISSLDAIESIDIIEEAMGVELRIWLKAPEAAEFLGRRRKIAGPTGCGLCGVESLTEAMRPPPKVGEGRVLAPGDIMSAVDAVLPLQVLNQETRAVHAAGFWQPERGLLALREDVVRR